MFPIGKKRRPIVEVLAPRGVEFRRLRHRTSGGRDSEENVLAPEPPCREQDRAVPAPRSGAAILGFTDGDSGASRQIDAFQLAVGEEGKILSVRRPEGRLSAFRSGDRLQANRAERPDKDL